MGLQAEFYGLLRCGWRRFSSNVCLLLAESELLTVFEPVLNENGEFFRVLNPYPDAEASSSLSCATPQTSLRDLEDVFEHLTVEMATRLRNAFGISAPQSSPPSDPAQNVASDDSPCEDVADANNARCGFATATRTIAEQYVIDSVDAWVSSRCSAVNRQLVVGCGVHPDSVDAALKRARQSYDEPTLDQEDGCRKCGDLRGNGAPLPDAAEVAVNALLADFVIELVFPSDRRIYGTAQDWLCVALEKSAAVDVDDDEAVANLHPPEQERASGAKRQRSGPNDSDTDVSCSALVDENQQDDEEEDGDDLIVSKRNVDRLMLSKPHLLPRYVIVERRRKLDDERITVFEAEHHYSMAELREFACTAGLDVSKSKGIAKKAGLAAAILAAGKARRDHLKSQEGSTPV
jgi:hypothetical protein